MAERRQAVELGLVAERVEVGWMAGCRRLVERGVVGFGLAGQAGV